MVDSTPSDENGGSQTGCGCLILLILGATLSLAIDRFNSNFGIPTKNEVMFENRTQKPRGTVRQDQPRSEDEHLDRQKAEPVAGQTKPKATAIEQGELETRVELERQAEEMEFHRRSRMIDQMRHQIHQDSMSTDLSTLQSSIALDRFIAETTESDNSYVKGLEFQQKLSRIRPILKRLYSDRDLAVCVVDDAMWKSLSDKDLNNMTRTILLAWDDHVSRFVIDSMTTKERLQATVIVYFVDQEANRVGVRTFANFLPSTDMPNGFDFDFRLSEKDVFSVTGAMPTEKPSNELGHDEGHLPTKVILNDDPTLRKARQELRDFLSANPEPKLEVLPERLWQDGSLQFSVLAQLVAVDNENVVLLKSDQMMKLTVKRAKLSGSDQLFLERNYSTYVKRKGEWDETFTRFVSEIAQLQKSLN